MKKSLALSGIFLLIMVGSTLVGLLPSVSNATVYAAGEDRLCIPSYSKLSGDRWKTEAFQFEIISRFEIKVTYKETGNCASPSNISSKFIHSSGLEFAPFANETLNFLLPFGAYTTSVNQDVDQSTIEVPNFGDVSDAEGSWELYINRQTATIDRIFKDAEYTIGIEEDDLNGVATCSGTNSNFHLINENNDGKDVKWRCDDDSTNETGADFLSNVKSSSKPNFNIVFKASEDGKTLENIFSDDDEYNFTFCEGENKFRNDSCNGDRFIDITPSAITQLGEGVQVLSVKKSGADSFDVMVAGAGNVASTRTGGGAAGEGENAPSCESEGGSLSWLLCAVLGVGDEVIQALDKAIIDLLTIPSEYYQNEGLELAWSRLRNIAYLLLVPVVLIMVIGTALGFDFVSAYTVKRALPRLIAATIFIALSFEITKFMVIFTNNIGQGIYGLIVSAFGNSGDISLASVFAPDHGDSSKGLFVGILAAGGLLAVGSIGILLSYILIAVVGLAIGFFLLSFRQLLIIALMILAPLAILAWIFPENDKPWKLWWGTFTKLLLLFPLIMILIAVGKSFALMVDGIGHGIVETLIKLVAYVGPYFLIPAMFKFAGGLFANIAGMTNDRSRGLFDRQKKYRAEKAAKNWGDFRKGDRAWRPQSFNTLGRRIDAGFKGGYGFGKRGAGALDIRSRAAAQAAMKDPLMEQLQFDDDGVLAMAVSEGNRGRSKQALIDYRDTLRRHGKDEEADKWTDDRIDKAVATAASVGFNRSNATAAIDMMGRNKSFSLAGGAAGMETMLTATSGLAGGNKQMAENLMGSFEFNSRQAGRMDLGMHDYATGTPNLAGAWGKATLSQHAQSAGPSLGAFADSIREDFASGDSAKKAEAAIRAVEMQNMLPYAHASNQGVITQLMEDLGVDYSKGAVDEQLVEKVNTTPAGTRVAGVTVNDIRSRARVYDRDDRQDIEGRRGGGGPPQGAGGAPGS
jgi:hypothetical protein